MTVKIRFHKALQRFTYGVIEHEVDADSYVNLMQSCMSIFPDLGKAVKRIGFERNVTEELVFIVDGRTIEVEEFMLRPPKNKVINICPIIIGQGKAGIMIAIGIAIVALVMLAPFAAPVVAGTAGVGLGTTAGFAAFTTATYGLTLLGSVLLGIGLSLIIQGIMSLLVKPPSTSDGGNRAANDMFEGLTITTSQMTPVTLIYGLNRHVGHLISGAISANATELIPVDEPRFYLGFIGRGDDTGPGVMELVVSKDGETWTEKNITNTTLQPITNGGYEVRQTSVVTEFQGALWVLFHDPDDFETFGGWGYRSTDYGKTWELFDYPLASTTPDLYQGNRLAVAAKPGLFVGVGFAIEWFWESMTLCKSTDGINWSLLNNDPPWETPDNFYGNVGIAYWPQQDIWILADTSHPDSATVWTTRDPVNSAWQEPLYNPGLYDFGFYAKTLATFPNIALIGGGQFLGQSTIWYSTDGRAWRDGRVALFAHSDGTTPTSFAAEKFILVNGIYYAGGYANFPGGFDDSMAIVKSNDGRLWSTVGYPMKGLREPNLGVMYMLQDFDYDPISGYFYIVGSTNLDNIFIWRSQDPAAHIWTEVYANRTVFTSDPYNLGGFYIRKTLWPSIPVPQNWSQVMGSDS